MSKNPVYTFADIEEHIIERLKWATQTEQGDTPRWCKKVVGTYDNELIGQTNPALHLVYEGFSVLDKNPTQTVEGHRWLITLVIKDAGAQGDSTRFHKQISIYERHIKLALKGFVPRGARGALVEMTPPPVIYEGALAFYMFRYEAHTLLSKNSGVYAAPPTPTNEPFLKEK